MAKAAVKERESARARDEEEEEEEEETPKARGKAKATKVAEKEEVEVEEEEETEQEEQDEEDDDEPDDEPKAKASRSAPKAVEKTKSAKKSSSNNDDAGESDDDIINWADVDEEATTELELVPKGVYPAIVDEVEFKISSKSNNPMIEVKFQNTHENYEKPKRFHWTYIVLTQKNIGRVKHDLKVLGVKFPTKEMSWKDVKRWFQKIGESDDLTGQECSLSIKIGKNQDGEKRNEVRAILPLQDEAAQGDDDFTD